MLRTVFTACRRRPRRVVTALVLLVVTAGALGFTWKTYEYGWRDATLRQRADRIAASRGIRTIEQPLMTFRGHVRPVSAVAFTPDGSRLVSAGGDGDATVKVWDAATGQLLATFEGHDRGIYDLTLSPDGTRVASAGHDHTAVIWDLASGKRLLTIGGLEIHVTGVAFSPDGSRLATGDGYGVRVWDVQSGRELL